MSGPRHVAVCGASDADGELYEIARDVGRRLAQAGAVVVSGGLTGVMEACARGASEAGGVTVGLLPGDSREAANPFLTVALPTGLGELRNGLIVRAADALIVVGGAYGTLSEIALGLHAGKPVYGLGTWDIDGVERVATAEEAVARAMS